MDVSQILTREEHAAVLADLHRRVKRSRNTRLNLTIFRLAACCGLRRKELCGLNLGDFLLGVAKPVLRIRKDVTKGREGKRKARLVPLSWDVGKNSTLEDLTAWFQERRKEGARRDDPFLAGFTGKRLTRDLAAKRWKTAIRVLGQDRLRQLSIHKGRHTFISHALAGGIPLVDVRDAAGHSNVSITNVYLHILDKPTVTNLFDYSKLKTEPRQ